MMLIVISPVKYIPSWFPGADFKRKAKLWRQESEDMLNLPFQEVKILSVSYFRMIFGTTVTFSLERLMVKGGHHMCRLVLIKWTTRVTSNTKKHSSEIQLVPLT